MSESNNISLGEWTIKFELSHLINVPNSLGHLYLYLPLLALTLTLNIWGVVVISGKEKTGINSLIVVDCFANFFIMAISTLGHSPWSNFEWSSLCTFFILFQSVLTVFNRLVPVAIATTRYIMICHPTFSINQGGEKRISAIVRNILIFITMASSTYSTSQRDKVLKYLTCMQREEMFR